MKNTYNVTHDKSGMILLTVLLLLSLLMAAGMGAVLSVQNDFRMSANLRGGAAASYLADAGIEWSKQQISRASTHPPLLANGSQSFDSGNFSVMFLSSTRAGPLGAKVMLRSIGSANNASQSIQALVTKIYDLADAALVLRGNARRLNFAGSSLSLSGFDHDLAGLPLSGSRPRAGITVGTVALLNDLDGALDDPQRRNITGHDGRGAAIAVSERIPGSDAARIAGDLCAAPSAVIWAVPSEGSLAVVNQIWGTRDAPQLHCINGLPGSGDTVMFGANTGGAGILVIRDAEMVLSEDFHWEGLVIVSGSDVGFRVASSASKEILGSLIVNESGGGAGSGPALLDIQGTIRMRFSREAFNLAAPLVPPATLTSSYGVLPVSLKQDYWRSLNP